MSQKYLTIPDMLEVRNISKNKPFVSLTILILGFCGTVYKVLPQKAFISIEDKQALKSLNGALSEYKDGDSSILLYFRRSQNSKNFRHQLFVRLGYAPIYSPYRYNAIDLTGQSFPQTLQPLFHF